MSHTLPTPSPAELDFLRQRLPAGLTEPMQQLAQCLFATLVAADRRCGSREVGADWAHILGHMADVARAQLLRITCEMGGDSLYIARGSAAASSLRDEQIWREFDGTNYHRLALKWGLTVMRVRQIVEVQRSADAARRNLRLPGFE